MDESCNPGLFAGFPASGWGLIDTPFDVSSASFRLRFIFVFFVSESGVSHFFDFFWFQVKFIFIYKLLTLRVHFIDL